MEDTNIFVGRQPIFNRHGNIYGYELLYRNSDENKFPDINPEKATLNLLMNTFLSIGAEKVAGKHKLFINFSEQLLKEEFFLTFNPEVIIIEILETVLITPEILKHIQRFKEAGYQIALDDFKMREDYFNNKDIFALVDIIKVDLKNTSSAEQIEIFALRQAFPQIKLLAEKVETKQQRAIAEQLSYDLFQGYFYAVPDILTGFDVAANPKVYEQIVDVLAERPVQLDKVSDCFMRDVSLAYKLFRYINSMNKPVEKPIRSIKDIVEELGADELRKWMQMMELHEIDDWDGRGDVRALVEHSILRGKLCSLLAKEKGLDNEDEYFLLGMFSLIDVIMKRELQEILPHLKLSCELERTLLGEQTMMANILNVTIDMEQFRVEEAYELAATIHITKAQLSECSREAYRWLHEAGPIF